MTDRRLYKFGHRTDTGQALDLHPDEFGPHMLIMGATGRGKSKFLESLLRRYLISGQGFCLIDPTGNLAQAILDFASLMPCPPEQFVYFAPWRDDWVTAYNPLARHGGDAHFLIKAMKVATLKCWGQDNAKDTPRIDEWLENVYFTGVHLGLTIPDLGLLLQPSVERNLQRRAVIKALPENRPEWREPWEQLCVVTERKNPMDYEMMVGATARRLSAFFKNPRLERIFGMPNVSLDLAGLMDNNGVMIVDLSPRGRIHPEDTEFVGTLLLTDFFLQMFNRKTPENPFPLVIDEFQNFITKDIARMLDMSRQYGLRLHLAHQRPGQLLNHADPEMKDVYSACLTNCACKVMFGGVSMSELEPIAQDLSVGVLDPYRVKNEIWTRGVVDYEREERQTFGRSHSHGMSAGVAAGRGSMKGTGTALGESDMRFSAESDGYGHADHSGSQFVFGDSSHSDARYGISSGMASISNVSGSSGSGTSSSRVTSDITAESDSEVVSLSGSDADGESESTTFVDVPVMGEQLSSRQYEDLREQLYMFASLVHNQPQRRALVRVVGYDKPIPIEIPFVKRMLAEDEDVQAHLRYAQKNGSSLLTADIADQRVLERKRSFLALGQPIHKPTVEARATMEASPSMPDKTFPEKPLSVNGTQLQPRDFALLRDVFECRFISIKHAAQLHFGENKDAEADARKRLNQLAKSELLQKQEVKVAGCNVIYRLTKRSVDLLVEHALIPEIIQKQWPSSIRRRYTDKMAPTHLAHELGLYDLKVALSGATAAYEHVRIGELGISPLPYTFPITRAGRVTSQKPDGFLRLDLHDPRDEGLPKPHYFYVEYDTGKENLDRLLEKVDGYRQHLRNGGFAACIGKADAPEKERTFRVLFFVHSAARRNNVCARLGQEGVQDLVYVGISEEVLRAPLDSIWLTPRAYVEAEATGAFAMKALIKNLST